MKLFLVSYCCAISRFLTFVSLRKELKTVKGKRFNRCETSRHLSKWETFRGIDAGFLNLVWR